MSEHPVQQQLQKLENEVRNLIMLDDSAHGTVCAIHSAVHTSGSFPQSNHHMLRLCPIPTCPNNSRIPIKEKRQASRSRSQSPRNFSPKYEMVCRNLSPQRKKPARPSQNLHRKDGYAYLNILNPVSCLNVEKTLSCPGKMCVCLKQTPSQKSNLSCKSSVQIDSRIANSIMCTDEIVSELKGEIERVKHQLYHIVASKANFDPQSLNRPIQSSANKVQSQISQVKTDDESANQFGKLKVENKRLKRELETKKKLLENSKKDVEKARDILSDYEMKVTLLHQQAIKSSKAMKATKERFCKCLKDKEERIQALNKENESMRSSISENGTTFNQVIEENDKLKRAFEETCAKCCDLNESNQNYTAFIEELKEKLEKSTNESLQYKKTVESIEKKLDDMNCACRKLTTKYRKQKESYESLVNSKTEMETKLSEELSNLSTKLLDIENSKRLNSTENEKLQGKCTVLENKLKEYEHLAEKCKIIEEECKTHCEILMRNEMTFQKSQEEMQNLIHELTIVVDSNKQTLLEMSETNKAQEMLIKTQSLALMSKEEQLRVIEKQSETFKKRSEDLEREVKEMKTALSKPCSQEACVSVSRELEIIRRELMVQKDNHTIAEKIIEDQSQTIINLQSQVREKMHQVNQAQSDTKQLENQLEKLNGNLQIKHRELNKQINEKHTLAEKLKILEKQKQHLKEEIEDFEDMLQKFRKTCGENESQKSILKKLTREIEMQKREWESEKEIMAKEKEKAECAAKFATQKLLDTVADFQKQNDAQKRVQVLLAKMLHEKDEQLKIVTAKISDINYLTNNVAYRTRNTLSNEPLKELFKNHSDKYVTTSEPNSTTNPSYYSSCTSCKKSYDLPFQPLPPNLAEKSSKGFCSKQECQNVGNFGMCNNQQCAKVQELFDMLKNRQEPNLYNEMPIREFTYD